MTSFNYFQENINLTNGTSKNASSYKTVNYEYSTKRTGSQPSNEKFLLKFYAIFLKERDGQDFLDEDREQKFWPLFT